MLLECTCSASMKQCERLRSLDSALHLSTAKIKAEQQLYCIHRAVLEKLPPDLITVADNPDEPDEGPSDLIEIEQQMNDPNLLWSVKVHGTYGIVKRSAKGNLSCTTCKKNRCGHVSTFVSNYKDFDIELPPVLPTGERCSVLSATKILYKDEFLTPYNYPLEAGSIDVALSKLKCCDHGVDLTNEKQREKRCTVWDELGRSYDGGPIYKKAANCPSRCQVSFDGGELGVINVNNDHLVEYSLLSLYMSFYERDGMPLVAFHEAMVNQNRRRCRDTIPYHILYRAWSGFLSLLSLDGTRGFKCDKCGEKPEVIILDGTALACRKDLLPKASNEVLSNLPALHGIPHGKRVFIVENKTRKLLRQFAVGGRNKEKEMSIADVQSMVQRIGDEFSGMPLQRLIIRLTENNQCSSPDEYRLFLRELAKNTPICGLFQTGFSTDEALRAFNGIISAHIDIASIDEQEILDAMRV